MDKNNGKAIGTKCVSVRASSGSR